MQTAFAGKRHLIEGMKYPLAKDALSTPPLPCEFNIGDMVTFTNDNGVQFHGRVVAGFSPEVENGRFVYLDQDAWWFPVAPTNLSRSGVVAEATAVWVQSYSLT